MSEPIAPCPFCGSECIQLAFGTQVRCADEECAYRIPGAFAAHNVLCRDVALARNLRKVTREGHVQCGPGKDRKTFAAACLARPNLLGVEIIRGRCAWNDTLDAALDELAAKIEGDDN